MHKLRDLANLLDMDDIFVWDSFVKGTVVIAEVAVMCQGRSCDAEMRMSDIAVQTLEALRLRSGDEGWSLGVCAEG